VTRVLEDLQYLQGMLIFAKLRFCSCKFLSNKYVLKFFSICPLVPGLPVLLHHLSEQQQNPAARPLDHKANLPAGFSLKSPLNAKASVRLQELGHNLCDQRWARSSQLG
jgi:hypothetical protein